MENCKYSLRARPKAFFQLAYRMLGLLCFLSILQSSPAQLFQFQQFTELDGLPGMDVYDVFQDSKGYIWVSTEAGVARYDGYEFNRIKLGGITGYSDVFGIEEDQQGRIWFRTVNGEMCFFFQNRIYNSTNSELCRKLSFSSATLSIQSKSDTVFFVSRLHGIKILIGDSVSSVQIPMLKGGTAVPGGFFVIGYNRAFVYDFESNQVFDSTDRSDSHVTTTYHDGNIYLGYQDKLFRYTDYQGNMEVVFHTSERPAEVIGLNSLSDSVLAVSTRKGVLMFNSRSNEIEKSTLEGIPVSSVLKDKEGGLWYSTLGKGLYYDPNKVNRPVPLLRAEMNAPVYCIYNDHNDSIWFGSTDSRVLLWSDGEVRTYELLSEKYSLRDRIVKIKKGKNGEVNILGKRGFMILYPDGGSYVRMGSGRAFAIDQESNLWAGGSSFYKFIPNPSGNPLWTRTDVHLDKRTNVAVLSGDSILIGSDVGLYSIPPSKDRFNRLEILGNRSIEAISLPYILTRNGELFTLDLSGIRPFPQSQKIDARCYALHLTEDIIYIATNRGLYECQISNGKTSLNQNLGRIKVFDVDLKGDSLLVASENGLFAMKRQRDSSPRFSPSLYIDSVLVNGSALPPERLTELSYQETNVKIFFTGLLFSGSPSYFYKVNDEAWQPNSARELNLKLSPGKYTVSIKATNEEEEFSEVQSIQISVAQPFWERLEFILLLILLVLGTVFLIWRQNVRRLARRHEHQREIDLANLEVANFRTRVLELEQKALQLQMNPHFLFNSINSIKGFYAQGKVREAINYIHHFSAFLRIIVENPKSLISVQKEVKVLEHYLALEKMKFPQLNYEIHVDEEVAASKTFIPHMLIQPFVENAIIHGIGPKGAPGLIQVRIELASESSLRIEIEDDGVGLRDKPAEPKKSSVGMRITSERLSLFNKVPSGDISLRPNPKGEGAIVSFTTRFVYE